MKNFGSMKSGSFLLIFLLVFSFVLLPVISHAADAGEKIHVAGYEIIGNEAIETDELLEYLADYQDKDYTLAELKGVAGKITALYQEEGYILAKAYIPKQEIVDGMVTIAVSEGELGFIEVTDNKYYTTSYVRGWFSHLKREAVREQDIERAILLANETSALNVTTAFRRGKKPGTSDLIIKVEDSYPLNLDLEYNNYGNPLISRNKMGVNLQTAMSLVSGSELNVRAMIGDEFTDTFYGHIDIQSPIGFHGARWGFRYLYADYFVGSELEILGIEGESQILGGYVKYPFLRSKRHNLSTTVGFDYKHMFQKVAGTQDSNDDLSIGYLRLDYDSIDRFFGERLPAKNYISLSYSHGFQDVFGSIEEKDDDSSNFGASGKFDRFNLDVVRVQKLWKDIMLLVRGSGQYTSDILTSGEKFSIGGANTVRGHRLSEFVGEKGYMVSAEASTSYPFIWLKNILFLGKKISDEDVKKTIRAVAFGDHGGVFLRDYAENPQIGKCRNCYITSVGLGTRVYLFDRLDFKFDIGYPFIKSEIEWGEEIVYLSLNYNAIKF